MIWSFYDPETGVISSRKFSGKSSAVAINTPPGLVAIAGDLDYLSARIVDGIAVDWIPPQPGDDHAWDGERKRWRLSDDATRRSAATRSAMDTISRLESMQLRPLRELALDPTNVASRERLADIDAQIENARHTLRLNPPPDSPSRS